MDVSDGLTVAKAATAAKGVFDYFKARSKSAEEAMKLMELHDAFQALRDENSQLRDKNSRLRDELRQRDVRASARDAYERKQIGNAVVLVRERAGGTDGPPCCPKCEDEHGEPLPLQGMAPAFRRIASHQCTSCNATFNLPGAAG